MKHLVTDVAQRQGEREREKKVRDRFGVWKPTSEMRSLPIHGLSVIIVIIKISRDNNVNIMIDGLIFQLEMEYYYCRLLL